MSCLFRDTAFLMVWIENNPQIGQPNAPQSIQTILTVSGACSEQDSCRQCWHHKMLPGLHEDWASSPVTLNTRRQEKGTAGSCYGHMHQPSSHPPLLLKDGNTLRTSGTGAAITADETLSGGYIWKNKNISMGFLPKLKAVR